MPHSNSSAIAIGFALLYTRIDSAVATSNSPENSNVYVVSACLNLNGLNLHMILLLLLACLSLLVLVRRRCMLIADVVLLYVALLPVHAFCLGERSESRKISQDQHQFPCSFWFFPAR